MSNIKIQDVDQRIQYEATAGQTSFSIPFPFFEASDLVVYKDDTLQTLTTDYTISGAGSPSGGTLTLTSGATAGDIITIEGDMPIDRTSIYSASISNLTGSDLNQDFNREVVMMKQIETTQNLLQLQYKPYLEVSQDVNVTRDRWLPRLDPSQVWAMNPAGTEIIAVDFDNAADAPADAHYFLAQPDGQLINGVDFGALSSGLLKHTVTGGVSTPATAINAVDYWAPGDTLQTDTLLVEDDIQHVGDTDNRIVFGADTQDYQTGGSSRLDLSDSGVRLGGANSRVTTILDEDSMGSDSATALATQQSIKAYVDAKTKNIQFLQPVRVASTSNFSATYNNGSSGVGATLTATSNGAATGDGITLSLGDRKLFKDQNDTFENGLYEVSQVGDASNPAIYTRATDFDEPNEIVAGDLVTVLEGNTLEHTAWLQTADVTNIGSDAINFVQFAADFDNIVTIDGTQTITGDKTFTGTTEVPTPTTDPEAANKGYVDAKTGFTETIYTSNDTWNKPAEFNADSFITVEVMSGGGGGGGTASTSSGEAVSSGAGGGGGYGYKKISEASLGSSETITVGSGGSAGSAGNNSGSIGGTSSFGSHVSCTGGGGGSGGAATGSNQITGSGDGGQSTGGDINVSGQKGGLGYVVGLVPLRSLGGITPLAHPSTASPPVAIGFGGGGPGNFSGASSPAKNGQDGLDGVVIIREYV